MTEFLSILVLTYMAGGEMIESEMQLPHAQCMAAERVISKAAAEPGGPVVEMWNGDKVPVRSATCIHGCPADAMADNWDLSAPLATTSEGQG